MFLTEMGFSAEECKDYGVAIMLKNFDISENLRIMIYKVGDDVRFYNSKYDDLCD